VTADDGRYSVGPFGVGLLAFVSVEQAAGWDGGRIESQVGRPVRIERAQDVEGVDFKLPKPDLRIAGVVFGLDAKPIAGAVVWTRPTRAGVRVVTGDDGRFVIEGLVRESYLVHAEQSGFPPAEVADVAAGTQDLRIQISAGAVLAGSVAAAINVRPIKAQRGGDVAIERNPRAERRRIGCSRSMSESGAT
jgi:hypothetical protein